MPQTPVLLKGMDQPDSPTDHPAANRSQAAAAALGVFTSLLNVTASGKALDCLKEVQCDLERAGSPLSFLNPEHAAIADQAMGHLFKAFGGQKMADAPVFYGKIPTIGPGASSGKDDAAQNVRLGAGQYLLEQIHVDRGRLHQLKHGKSSVLVVASRGVQIGYSLIEAHSGIWPFPPKSRILGQSPNLAELPQFMTRPENANLAKAPEIARLMAPQQALSPGSPRVDRLDVLSRIFLSGTLLNDLNALIALDSELQPMLAELAAGKRVERRPVDQSNKCVAPTLDEEIARQANEGTLNDAMRMHGSSVAPALCPDEPSPHSDTEPSLPSV